MCAGRTIIAAVVAFAVAVLPITASTGHSAKLPPVTDTSGSGDMSASQHMPDCCLPETAPCDAAKGPGGSMAVCALTCCFLVPASSGLVLQPILAGMVRTFESNVFGQQTGRPPFRPPRV